MYLANSFGPRQRERVTSGMYAGWLVSPQTRGIPQGVNAGQAWAGDNGRFAKDWTAQKFTGFLAKFRPYLSACLWMLVPDVVGDWKATRRDWIAWSWIVRKHGYPLAYAGQDDQPVGEIPWDEVACYFVGGTDAWKDSADSLAIVREARERGVRVHVGRANTRPRLEAFFKAYRLPDDPPGELPGFTFDGNGRRFPGKDRELAPAFALLYNRSMDL